MDRFWRSVSIVMGALLAAGCTPRTKYGIETGDTGEIEAVQDAAAPADLEGRPLPSHEPALPAPELIAE
jgi:hypothetical protein